MQIDTRVNCDVVLIEPKGRLTVETEAQFTKAVSALLETGRRRLVLNLVDVPYIDSVGLGAIVQAYTTSRHRGGDLKLLHVNHRNRQLLATTKLLTVFDVFDTEDEVVRSFDRRREEMSPVQASVPEPRAMYSL
jgi:anti-anti-sigma factor